MTTITLDAPTPDPEPRPTPVRGAGETAVQPSSRVAQPDALTPSKPPRSPWTAVRSAVSAASELPDIVKEPRPPLREVWLYAACGQWTGRPGEWTPVRVAAVAYAALAAIPLIALGYLLLWVVERPARAAVAASVYVLLKLAL